MIKPSLPFDFEILYRQGIERLCLRAGEKVFREEDPVTFMFVVLTGKIQIVTHGTVLENVGPGGIFGEMALIDDGERSASAIAIEDSEVAPIDRAAFLVLIRNEPEFAIYVMRTLVRRIRNMNYQM